MSCQEHAAEIETGHSLNAEDYGQHHHLIHLVFKSKTEGGKGLLKMQASRLLQATLGELQRSSQGSVSRSHLCSSWKQRFQSQHLRHDGPDCKQVHRWAIVRFPQQHFRSTIPPCADILRVWWLRISLPCQTKICYLYHLVPANQ